jgi:hypothetical protein
MHRCRVHGSHTAFRNDPNISANKRNAHNFLCRRDSSAALRGLQLYHARQRFKILTWTDQSHQEPRTINIGRAEWQSGNGQSGVRDWQSFFSPLPSWHS